MQHPGTQQPNSQHPRPSDEPSNTQHPGQHNPTMQHTGEPRPGHPTSHMQPTPHGSEQSHSPTGRPGGINTDLHPTTEAATAEDNRANIGANPLPNASVAGIASGLCAGAVMVALGAFYLHRRRKQGKPILGRWGSQRSAASGPYPQVAWLYDPKMSPPGSPGHSRSGSGAEANLLPREGEQSREMEAGMASPNLRPARPSSPLLAPLHMPPSRDQSPDGRRSSSRSRSASRARSTDRLRVVNND